MLNGMHFKIDIRILKAKKKSKPPPLLHQTHAQTPTEYLVDLWRELVTIRRRIRKRQQMIAIKYVIGVRG